ncbi:MAG TPA: peptidyl-prolyl cis-trans isomerase [Anaeromyxobacteraceae bacterium]|nr:peptidyl-prolyl cis-trans isomerase [Anaeromyxobacteraceae bacterium]
MAGAALRRAPALVALVALAASGCRCGEDKSRGRPPPPSVAMVNGEPVSTAAFQRELQHARSESGEGQAPLDLLRQRVLEEMVSRALLLQQARARGVTVEQEQVERAFLGVRSEYPGTHFDDLLAQQRLSAAELKQRLREQLTLEKLFQDEVFPQVRVEEPEVQRYYGEHEGEFDQPERVRVLQVVVKTREEALKVRDEIRRAPQKFGDVARRASISPEGKNGGDLGYFGRDAGMPEVFDACFRLPLNAVSDVVPSPYGFHVFKVVDRKPASRRTLPQARAEIFQKLLRERRARAQEDYLAGLRARAQIRVDETALAAVIP